MDRRSQQWVHILVCVLTVLRTGTALVDTTYVERGVAKGAVCLDGSPPAYNLDRGFGSGVNNWLVHVEGGGWCNNASSCLDRSTGFYGSSKAMPKLIKFGGLLSNDSQFNPDFYNWNRVKVRYCDGASFSGDVEAVDPDTKLYYRGARIFFAIMEDILHRGMKNAENALLSGCSAGGLAIFLHCDNFKSLLPQSTKVKCLSDAGFFINAKDISGSPTIEDFFDEVVTFHGIAKNLRESCTSRMKPSLCFFPQYYAQGIQTPLFILNSGIDAWQIPNILVPDVADPFGLWKDCKTNITKCSTSQLHLINGYRKEFKDALSGLGASQSRGYFIHSCSFHCHTEHPELWFESDALTLFRKSQRRIVCYCHNHEREHEHEHEICLLPKDCPTC